MSIQELARYYLSQGKSVRAAAIAHSFGTYISGRALRLLSWPYFNRIVLAGCVLDENYPWNEVQQNNPTRFEEVRNEMAARDNKPQSAQSSYSFSTSLWLSIRHGARRSQSGKPDVTARQNPNDRLRELLVALAAHPTSEGLWSALYKHIYPYVFAVAFRAVRGSKESAKDATRVVFLRLFKHNEFTEFSEPEEFLGYVATIARHAALDLNKSEAKYVTGLDLTLCDFLPGSPTPQQHEQARKTLADVLEHLGQDERQLVDLLVQGMSLEEIALRLGISYANAAVRIHRLRERMVKRLKTREI